MMARGWPVYNATHLQLDARIGLFNCCYEMIAGGFDSVFLFWDGVSYSNLDSAGFETLSNRFGDQIGAPL